MSVAAGRPRTAEGAAGPGPARPAGGGQPVEPSDGPPPRLPDAWSSRWRPVAKRAAFVAAVDALTLLGLVLVGDPLTQWWALLVPLVLLVGPVFRLVRSRSLRAPSAGHAGQRARFRRRRAQR